MICRRVIGLCCCESLTSGRRDLRRRLRVSRSSIISESVTGGTSVWQPNCRGDGGRALCCDCTEPNAENATEEVLLVDMEAASNKRSYRRQAAIRALLKGYTPRTGKRPLWAVRTDGTPVD